MEAEVRPDVVVMGLGNVLLMDDGVGIAALHRLRRDYRMPAGVELLDGGTLGLSLLPYIERARHLILLDAVRADGASPGDLVRVEGAAVAPVVAERLSPHQVGVADLLAGAHLLERYPDSVVLLGVAPAEIELGTERTPDVEASLPALVEMAAQELARIGFGPASRSSLEVSDEPVEEEDVVRALGL